MTSKELKRLGRGDLLEMMLALSKENQLLKERLAEAERQIADRKIQTAEAGSLAEASLRLNGVFEAAQAAGDQYVENMRLLAQEQERRCRQMEQETQAKCAEMLARARQEAVEYLARAKQEIAEKTQSYAWLTDIMNQTDGAQ